MHSADAKSYRGRQNISGTDFKVVPALNQEPRHENTWSGALQLHVFLTLAVDGVY